MSLGKLPVELILDIADDLDPCSLCSWSRASRYYRFVVGGEALYRQATRFDQEQYRWPRYLSRTIWVDNMPAFIAMLERTNDINNQRVRYTGRPRGYLPVNKRLFNDYRQKTLLHLASELGRDEMVRRLLDKGADMSLIDDVEQTPLQVAITNRRTAVLKILLDFGANPSGDIGRVGFTPLELAIKGNYVEGVRLLLDAGAKINGEVDTLRYAATFYCDTGDPTVIEMLIQSGIDVATLRSEAGVLALQGAGMHRNISLVRRLIDAGVKLRLDDMTQREIPPAVKLAIMKNDAEVDRFLAESGYGFSHWRVTLWDT